MAYFGILYGAGQDSVLRQVNSIREIDLASPRWQRFGLSGNWAAKSPPLAVIEVYENVRADGARAIALFTECQSFEDANERIMDFFIAAAVWYAGATIDQTTSYPSPVPYEAGTI